jgi:phage tail-like protein
MGEGAKRGTISGLETPHPLASGLPALYDEPKQQTFSFPRADFVESIRRISRPAARHESRPVLTGIVVRFEEGRLLLSAGEPNRGSTQTPVVDASNRRPEATVPARTLAELASLLREPGVDELEISVQDDEIVFYVDGTAVPVRRTDGRVADDRPLAAEGGDTVAQLPIDPRRKRLRASLAHRFTAALDEVLAPVFLCLDNLDAYLDPRFTPVDFLPWLAGWVGVTLPEAWPEDRTERLREERRRRMLVARAVPLHGQRGTAGGLAQHVEVFAGVKPEIIESGGVAWSTKAGMALPGSPRPHVVVRLEVEDQDAVDVGRVRALVAAAKPAHVVADVEVVPA